ncbi:MAG: GYD domain-containing protein [Chloroflexota bacterium]|nr:GYD domain-containing protein [Chloroflexota bacterium]
MPLYLYQLAYTAESLAAQIKQPQDRIEVVRPWLEAAGAKLLGGGYSFGDYDATIIYEAADDTVAASVALSIGAGGALKSARTTKLLSGQEWVAALEKAQKVAPQYRPAR